MYCKHCGKEIADDSKFCQHCGGILIEESQDLNSLRTTDETNKESTEIEPKEAIVEIKKLADEKTSNNKIKPLPLLRRLFASVLDKILILVIAVCGYLAYKPYAGTGDIGFFMGLMNNKPSNFDYIDKYQIEHYGTIKDGVDFEYQMKARLESDVPYIGYTKDFDLKMCLIFLLVNVIYYVLFELTLRSSLGKKLFGGKLMNESGNTICFWRILSRSLFLGLFVILIVFLFRYQCNLDYYSVTIIFFLLMDVPLFFTQRSLLDLCTKTMYADVLTKKDWKGKYGEPDILAKKRNR